MAHVVFFVLECGDLCHDILNEWAKAGAPGATILESMGLARIRKAMRDDLPLVPSLRDLLRSEELHNRTIFTVIDDDEVLKRVLEVTQEVVDFSQPHSGLLFVVPVTHVFGLKKH